MAFACACGWLLQLGRRLMPRSEPPQPKKVLDEIAEQASREEEELAYYFMPWLCRTAVIYSDNGGRTALHRAV